MTELLRHMNYKEAVHNQVFRVENVTILSIYIMQSVASSSTYQSK